MNPAQDAQLPLAAKDTEGKQSFFEDHIDLARERSRCFWWEAKGSPAFSSIRIRAIVKMKRSSLSSLAALVCTRLAGTSTAWSFPRFGRMSSSQIALGAVDLPDVKPTPKQMTPRSAPLNFGPASQRDSTLYTAQRPGHNPADKHAPVTRRQLTDWMNFMQSQGIVHIIALLDENEVQIYPEDLLEVYAAHGFQGRRIEMRDLRAQKRIFRIIQSAQEKNERVVVHCTGGVGRAGRVAAGWLVERYGLSLEEATEETLQVAETFRMKRKGDANMLGDWLKP